MSFGLAVHNWRTLPLEGGAAATPEDGELEQLRVETSIGANHSQNVRGLIAAGANGKVMWHAGGDLSADSTIFFSSDGGETWSDKGLTLPDIPNDADSYISNLQYYQPDDTWYIVALDLGVRATYMFYSTNDGTSWTRDTFDNGSISLTVHGLGMDVSDGYWMVAGRGTGNDGTFARKSAPGGSASIVQHNFPSTAYSTVKLGSKYYIKNRSSVSSVEQYITVVDFGAGSATTYGNWAESTYGSSDFSESDGTRFFCPKGSRTPSDGIITLGVFTASTDYTTPGSEDEVTLTYPEQVRYLDTVYGNGWVSLALPYNSGEERRYIYAHYSADGITWSSTPVKFTLPSGPDYGLDEDASTWRAKWGGGSTWYLAGTAENYDSPVDTNRPGLWRFSLNPQGGTYPPAPFSYPLYDTIQSMSPDIFVKLDDEAGSTTVEDIGSKGYGNAVVGDVTFEEVGIVSDGGTAATFDNAAASIDFSSVRYTDHTHVLIFDAPATTELTLVETSAYAIVTDASGNILFRDSLGNETDLEIDEGDYDAIIVRVNDQQITAWGLGSYAATKSFTAAAQMSSAVGTLSLEGAGVTTDYYALIPNANLDIDRLIAALATEFSATPSAAPAPSIGDGSVLCIVNAEDSLSTTFDQGRTVYDIGNDVPGQQPPVSEVYGMAASNVSTTAKFGSKALYTPYKSSRSNTVPVGPYWRGLHATSILSRDFTIEGWVKPTLGNNFCYLGSSQRYTRVGSRDYRYGGITVAISGSSGAGKMTVNVGHPVGTARSLRDNDLYRGNALTINANFPSFNDNDWNHVVVARKNGIWYLYINGKADTARGHVGNTAAPIYDGGDWHFGAYLYPYSYTVGGRLTVSPSYGGGGGTTYYGLALYSQPVYIDSFRFVLDEAVYTQEFAVPTAAFSA